MKRTFVCLVLACMMLISLISCDFSALQPKDTKEPSGTSAEPQDTTGKEPATTVAPATETEEPGTQAPERVVNRVFIVSDMHYTTSNKACSTSAAAGNCFGMTQDQKVEKIFDEIDNQLKTKGLDMVLVLGDIGLDQNLAVSEAIGINDKWKQADADKSYIRKFCDRFTKRFGSSLPLYCIAGNHDSYSTEQWNYILRTDNGRQYAVEWVNDVVFLMMDTFSEECSSNKGSGSEYCGVDYTWLNQQLTKYKGKHIILCSHYFNTSAETQLANILKTNNDIVWLYHGHGHRATATDWCGKKIIMTGGYAYNGVVIGGKYEFNSFQSDFTWGYQLLTLENGVLQTWHEKPAYTYVDYQGQSYTTTKKTLNILRYDLNK